jgi:hypothetical protein
VPLAFRPVFESISPVLRQPPFCLVRTQAILGGIGRAERPGDLCGRICHRLLWMSDNGVALSDGIRHWSLILGSRRRAVINGLFAITHLQSAPMVTLDLHQNTNRLRW